MFVLTLKGVPGAQLVEDKLCLLNYNLNSSYCLWLPVMNETQDILGKKSAILAESTNYLLYATLILTIPSILTSVFIGAWTDRYQPAKKMLLIVGGLSGVLEALINIITVIFYDISPLYNLISPISMCFSGGMLGLLTAFWSYIALTTPRKYMALRMTFAEVMMSLAQPFGTYVGGAVLNMSPLWANSGQLHNYMGVYLICGVAYLLATIWTLFMIDERKDMEAFQRDFGSTNGEEEDMSLREEMLNKQKQYDDNRHIHPIRLLFDCRNVKDMFITCWKRRTNYVRLQLWLLFLSMAIYIMAYMGPITILFAFVQKVYKWNSATFSNISAIGSLISVAAIFVISPILIKVLGFKDTTLSMVGLVSFCGQYVLRGVILNPNGFYLSIPVGMLGAIGSIGIRSHFSKIVEPRELGKVSSLMAAIDSVIPLVGSSFYSSVFNATMDTNPGLSFIITGCILALVIRCDRQLPASVECVRAGATCISPLMRCHPCAEP
ncbi:unnamed protein product [Medioppia subpectinata]|uniref:Uncharacterized protein n=1 Tax=Medioppia subpectinata TaxID=1979941 RepID=A0A7R9KP17_9ACAR|nr:unnamed protein product [Medioppia subpectinata]CAG2106821.1 unnamed protein product [Medioppia subpectinata]